MDRLQLDTHERGTGIAGLLEDLDASPVNPALPAPAAAKSVLPPQTEAPYLDALRGYSESNPARFHVPGHKGVPPVGDLFAEAFAQEGLGLDIPLCIEGVDIGPAAPLEIAQQMAAEAWGARRSWFLTNGASQGNHAICMAIAQLGSEILMQRNVHMSAIDGVVLSGLKPTFVAPELNPMLGVANCLTPASLAEALDSTPNAVAAMVVSPTYFGAVADVRGLADVAHERGVALIVDEAWGAHFAFHPELPEHALAAGADVVLTGAHKLVGSLSQSAVLHLGQEAGRWLNEELFSRAVSLVSTTSPSSLLLGSLDAARRDAVVNGYSRISATMNDLGEVRRQIRRIRGLEVLDDRSLPQPGVHSFDPLRLTIDVRGTGASGFDLAWALRENENVHLELASEDILVALFGMSEDAAANGARLVAALRSTVKKLPRQSRTERKNTRPPMPVSWGPLAVSPRDAFLAPHERIPIEDSIGRISAEGIAPYPPGIPMILPGERLTPATIAGLITTVDSGGIVRGASDPSLSTIHVIAESRQEAAGP